MNAVCAGVTFSPFLTARTSAFPSLSAPFLVPKTTVRESWKAEKANCGIYSGGHSKNENPRSQMSLSLNDFRLQDNHLGYPLNHILSLVNPTLLQKSYGYCDVLLWLNNPETFKWDVFPLIVCSLQRTSFLGYFCTVSRHVSAFTTHLFISAIRNHVLPNQEQNNIPGTRTSFNIVPKVLDKRIKK